jgi:hypothetical protein
MFRISTFTCEETIQPITGKAGDSRHLPADDFQA